MKWIAVLFALMISYCLKGQENQNKNQLSTDIGVVFHKNALNEDSYLNDKSPVGLTDGRGLVGIDLRFTIPTKINFIDISFGTMIEIGWDEFLVSKMDYVINGGGVYVGLSPKLGGKYFGITSLISVGVFSYKEYFSYYSDNPLPVVDIYEKKASFGLGAMSSVGVYANIGPVGLHPQVQAVFSGGNDASFLFYGFVFPLTIRF